jgi:Domain of unknown function (DUF5020)
MKWILFLVLLNASVHAQTLQFHYDLRKTVDPKRNPKNYGTLYFEYWKGTDSSSLLIKIQADLLAEKGNMGKVFMQVARSFHVYKAFQLHLSYSGGMGLTQPREYSYYITNTFAAGLSYPFQWNKAFLSAVLDLKFIPYKKPSFDPIFTLYWWKGLHNYQLEFSGDFSVWTENRDHGDILTSASGGKRFSFFAEPQVWFSLRKNVAIGSRVNLFYHVLYTGDSFQVYPTVGLKCKL